MNHLSLPRLRTASWARAAAVAVAVLLVCWLVVARSTSAFSDTTANGGNLLETGFVELADDDGESALFSLPGMRPGDPPAVRCIVVTYTGDFDASTLQPVRLYGSPSSNDALAPFLDLEVKRTDAASSCLASGAASGPATTIFSTTAPVSSTGTLQAFLSNHTSYANGVSTTGWTPATNGDSRAYEFTITLKDTAPQGEKAEPTFIWEVQSS